MIVEKLDDRIFVYKQVFADPILILNELKEKKEWRQWYSFGTQTTVQIETKKFGTFPNKDEWDNEINKYPDIINSEKEIMNIFYNVTAHYVNTLNIHSNNWCLVPPSICQYYDGHGADPSANVGMVYHTDFQQEDPYSPGPKHVLTCNMYLNDDYEQGEIIFKIFDKNGEYRKVPYKPQAGDIVIFPSTEPYYHGVKVARNGNKFFVRSFWYDFSEGTKEWHDNKNKYGEELWLKMEADRKHVEVSDGRYHRNDKQN